jgi:hypothetical protein
LAQQTPAEQPPAWLASPSEYQAPPAPSQYEEWTPASEAPPDSFVQSAPVDTQAQRQAAAANQGFSFTVGNTTITGWHAAALIGGFFAVWTALQLNGDIGTQSAYQAFVNAPPCNGAVNDSCRYEFASQVTGYKESSSTCSIDASGSAGDWTGEFPIEACSGLREFFRLTARVGVWQGQLVYVWRGGTQYWSTNSPVGQHMSASSGILLPLLLDAVFVLALIFGLISRLRRKAAH